MQWKISLGPSLDRLFCGVGYSKFVFLVEATQIIVELVGVGGLEVSKGVDPELGLGLHPLDRYAC